MASARAFWRWLTSMRTALLLLLLLAVAAVPGSALPQRGVSIEKVNAYRAAHPGTAAWLDRLGFFDVFASPWFSAIYLLLFVSLLGCLVPRLRQHLANLVSRPPPAPARLDRLPHCALDVASAQDASHAGGAIAAGLRRQRWRVSLRQHDDGAVSVAAEKGYLKETGNLVFHFALLAVLTGVALGSWYGWHGNRLVVAGEDFGFCDTVAQYDEYALGARTRPADLPPFCVTLRDFTAGYLADGQPVQFRADISYVEGLGGAERSRRLEVNDPLRLTGANLYLLGHGFAPVLRYTDRFGVVQTTVVPFLPVDAMLTSSGVAMFPDANIDPAGVASGGPGSPAAPGHQVAFAGTYLPTRPDRADGRLSVFPDERRPALFLVAYQGDLGLGAGIPHSVYTLDQSQVDAGRLRQVATSMALGPGDTWTLPDGSRVQFLGTRPYITVSVRDDPGQPVVLAGAAGLLVGLMVSLAGRRRRVWARVVPATSGGSLISFGGLARTPYPGFADEFAAVVSLAPAASAEEPVAVGEKGQ